MSILSNLPIPSLPPIPQIQIPTAILTAIRTTRRRLASMGWREILLTSALLLALVQTIRLEGAQVRFPIIGTVGPEGWKPKAERFALALVQFKRARDAANAQAIAAKQSEEEALVALAKEADNAQAIANLQSELERARDFSARNRISLREFERLRNQTGSSPSRPAAATSDNGTGVDAAPDPTSVLDEGAYLVAVPEADIEICTINTDLAERWREWGLAIEARSLAAQK